jgi:hypothetical protein
MGLHITLLVEQSQFAIGVVVTDLDFRFIRVEQNRGLSAAFYDSRLARLWSEFSCGY